MFDMFINAVSLLLVYYCLHILELKVKFGSSKVRHNLTTDFMQVRRVGN